ncbi:MAG: hypothetical protein NVS3B25_28870 [Hymenobacter sp.]
MSRFFVRLWRVSLLVLAAACHPHRVAPPAIKQLEGTWLLSREEISADTLVYRPNTYAFPAVRGRTGFALKPYGRFEQFDIAPTDGLTGRPGTWTADGNARLRIHLADSRDPDYTLEIISLHHRVLKLRRL